MEQPDMEPSDKPFDDKEPFWCWCWS
jgi:hypothetical protein